MSDFALRSSFNALIQALIRAGDHDGARRAAELAVAQGYWARPDQRPLHFLPGLPARPVHEAAGFALARYLDSHAETVREEVLAVLGPEGAGLLPVEEPLLGAGSWNLAAFYEDGSRSALTCARFPRTAAVIDGAPEEIRQAGVVTLSWLDPGTHILPHCGLSNARLRLHLPLRVAAGAFMRVADQTVTWEVGRSVVFDDSFEHEVFHNGTEPRLVLLVDFFHPSLSEAERRSFVARFNADPNGKIARFLRGAGLEALALVNDASMRVRFAREQDQRIRRYMAESDLKAIRLAGDERIVAEIEPSGD
jgi:hypothetical protein